MEILIILVAALIITISKIGYHFGIYDGWLDPPKRDRDSCKLFIFLVIVTCTFLPILIPYWLGYYLGYRDGEKSGLTMNYNPSIDHLLHPC